MCLSLNILAVVISPEKRVSGGLQLKVIHGIHKTSKRLTVVLSNYFSQV